MRTLHWLTLLILVTVAGSACTVVRPAQELIPAAEPEVFRHDAFARALAKHVDGEGKVDYAALKADDADLRAYFAQLAAFSPDSHPELFPTRDHELAYWLNAYNATVLVYVIEEWPIESVLTVPGPKVFFFLPDGSGFFFFTRAAYGEDTRNLLSLEREVVTERFGDPRSHFALNCASLGCPELPRVPFDPATLQAQLDAETREFLANELHLRLDPETRTVHISSLFDWYGEEFLEWSRQRNPAGVPSILDFVAAYAPPATTAALNEGGWTVEFIEYDWLINATEIRDPS